MLSSIFSSKKPVRWGRLGAFVGLAFTILLAVWEIFWRALGLVPVHNDTRDLWADQRDLASRSGARTLTIIGSSRVFYGLDLDLLARKSKRRVLQLAVNGNATLPYLEDLASDPSVQGTVLCGIVPRYFFNFSRAYRKAVSYVEYRRKRTPADRLSHWITFHLEKFFAYPSKEELGFQLYLEDHLRWGRKILKERLPPGVSRQLTFIAANRATKMPDPVFHSTPFRFHLRKRLIRGLKKHSKVSEKERREILRRTGEATRKLLRRNVKVVFLRMPSSGEYLAREKALWPRKNYWDEISRVAGAPGVHFEDHAELRGFQCPDLSHLRREDATRYTERLYRILGSLGAI